MRFHGHCADTQTMPVEETMWDVPLPKEIDRYDTERLRAELAGIVRSKLAPGKRLLRVVTWYADGGTLFRPRPGVRRFAVAYEIALGG